MLLLILLYNSRLKIKFQLYLTFFALFFIDRSLSWEDLLQRKRKLVFQLFHTKEYDPFNRCSVFILHTCLVSPTVDAQLDDVGLGFVKNSITAIEKRGTFET